MKTSFEVTYSQREDAGVQARLLELQPQEEQQQPINKCHRCIRSTPYFTLIQCILVILFYTLGIYGIVGDKIDLSVQPLSAQGPQSPKCAPGVDKHCQYQYFKVASYWDDCADKTKQYYRLFSYQYAHGGLLHIGMNVVSLLGFGSSFEIMVGPWCTFLFYELSAVFGALAWSWAYPYEGIVGMSCGIYGIIGGLVAFCILKHDSMTHRAHVVLAIAMAGKHIAFQKTLSILSHKLPSLLTFSH